MGKIYNVLKWTVTLGQGPQNFLGAKWIGSFLGRIPQSRKRAWALRILSLSPHYFIFPDAPEYKGMSNDEYLEASFDVITESRDNIFRLLLKRHLNENDVVLDYGCGPGFLAKAASSSVRQIYAIDISAGAIACARILKPADNIEYLIADENGLGTIPDGSVDAVYSYAVVQHLSDAIFRIVLENCRRKLRPNGRLLLHIQLPDDIWRTEQDWLSDRSFRGKLKFNYGLHCFGRTETQYRNIVEEFGFRNIEFEQLVGFDERYASELRSQRLLVAMKGPTGGIEPPVGFEAKN